MPYLLWLWCAALAWCAVSLPCVRRQLDRLGRPRMIARVVVWAILSWATWVAATKPPLPVVGDRLGNLVLWLSAGRIEDPTGVVAEHAQAAALLACEEETGGIIGEISGAVEVVGARIEEQTERLAADDTPIFYVIQDVPRDLPGYVENHNLSVTAEKIAMTGSNVFSVWFRYSWETTAAADIAMRVYASSNQSWLITSYTNSFPDTVDVNGVDTYRHDFDVTRLGIGATDAMALIPPYEATFGGPDGEPFAVPGLGVAVAATVAGEGTVTTNVGATGWVWLAPPWTNMQLRVVGGAVVEALWCGTNVAGVVSL
jgi:hypothetical protein